MKALLVGWLVVAGVMAQADTVGNRDERALIAYMLVKPGTEQTFLKAAVNVIEESRKETGNLIYELHQSVTNPQQFVFYELFQTNEDMQYHRKAKHTQDFLRQTKPIVVKNGFILEEYELKSRPE